MIRMYGVFGSRGTEAASSRKMERFGSRQPMVVIEARHMHQL